MLITEVSGRVTPPINLKALTGVVLALTTNIGITTETSYHPMNAPEEVS